jgi:hypothetical protein
VTREKQNYPPEKPDPALNATEGQRRLGGITGKGFMPGHSGNPKGLNGRQKGLAAMVRTQTRDGTVLVRLMYRILRGGKFKRTIVTRTGGTADALVRPSIRDRLDAAVWLAERGWGKPKEMGEGSGRPPFMIVLPGHGRDPLEEPETVEQAEPKLPALPAQMEEIGFELNLEDLEE